MSTPFATGWCILTSGPYEGLTLLQVLFRNPTWFFDAYAAGEFSGDLLTEAHLLYRLARHIRIPGKGRKRLLVEYGMNRRAGRFEYVEIVRASDSPDPEYRVRRKEVLDLGAALDVGTFNKNGIKRMIQDIKRHLFKDASYRMTRRRCEKFFNNMDNFDLGASTAPMEVEDDW